MPYQRLKGARCESRSVTGLEASTLVSIAQALQRVEIALAEIALGYYDFYHEQASRAKT